MCPVCGTPLGLASESPQAQHERAYIERLIAQCKSKDDVKRALVAEFGDSVLALPGDEGDTSASDVIVYVVPALGILLAAGGIAFAWIRWRRARRRGGDRNTLATADGARLEDDMERYDL
jgi:cytochrome c-type biogenesis protein CcmH